MSHFTVLVPAKNKEHLEEVLQPYHEYECTGVKDQYVVWVDDIHDKYWEEFNNDTVEVIVKEPLLLRGSTEVAGLNKNEVDVLVNLYNTNGDKFSKTVSKYSGKVEEITKVVKQLSESPKPTVVGTKYERTPEIESMWKRKGIGISGADEFELKPAYKLVDMPFNEYYADFDTFMEDWCGYTDKKDGRFGRWTNSNAKWDWWLIGGRWMGKLQLKSFESMEHAGDGTPGLMTEPNDNPLTADYAKSGDVDWDEMANIWRSKQKNWWTESNHYLQKAKDGAIPNDVLEDANKLWHDEHRKEYAHETFGNLETCQIYKYAQQLANEDGEYWWHDWDEIKQLLMPEEEFDKTLEIPYAMTYAFIDLKGNWNQRGEMGWWGMDDKEQGTVNYDAVWWDFIKTIPDDMLVFVVDCHI